MAPALKFENHSAMHLQPVPGTDIRVSRICLGTMTFGNPVGRPEAIRLVHAALERGINFVDTADMYEGYDRRPGSPGGVAESILGEALRGRRASAVITTKVGNPVGDPRYRGQGLSRAHILHQIDASLARLETSYVDFYLLHRPDPETPLDESIAVMDHLVETGKIRHWGVSNFSGRQIRGIIRRCEANGWRRPVIHQPPLSWLKRDELEDSIPVCREYHLAVTPYQPLQGGLLTGRYRRDRPVPADSRAAESAWLAPPDDATLTRLEAFEAEARAAGRAPARYAVDWLLAHTGVTSVVLGVKRWNSFEELFDDC